MRTPKQVSVKVRNASTKAASDIAEDVYTKGAWLTHIAVENKKGCWVDVFNCRYNGKTYFLVVCDRKVKECIEL